MEKIFIDKIAFKHPLDVDYDEVFGMISSHHDSNCCERHELDFDNSRQDFAMVEDILKQIDTLEIYGEDGMGVTFFFYDGEKRVGIFVPGRGGNNGFYGDNIELVIKTPDNGDFSYDVSDYQDY